MPSNFVAFDVKVEAADGAVTPAPLATVHVRDVTNGDDLPDLLADADGHVPGDSLDVDAGTTVHFYTDYIEDQGCGFAVQVTT